MLLSGDNPPAAQQNRDVLEAETDSPPREQTCGFPGGEGRGAQDGEFGMDTGANCCV